MVDLIRILCVEDSEDDFMLISHELKKRGYITYMERVETSETMYYALKSRTWDLVLSDNVMPRFSANEAIDIVTEIIPELPFVIVSAEISTEQLKRAYSRGCCGYVRKERLDLLDAAIRTALR